jgi:hypothetical protein
MSASFVTFNPSGNWEGEGKEVRLVRVSNAVESGKLKITKSIKKYQGNVYKVTDTYYFPDGSINYGPINYLIDTNGNNNFICSDDYGSGIDTYLFSNKQMTFSYNINGASEVIDPVYGSLNGTYDLVKKN